MTPYEIIVIVIAVVGILISAIVGLVGPIKRRPKPTPARVYRLLGTAEEREADPDRWL